MINPKDAFVPNTQFLEQFGMHLEEQGVDPELVSCVMRELAVVRDSRFGPLLQQCWDQSAITFRPYMTLAGTPETQPNFQAMCRNRLEHLSLIQDQSSYRGAKRPPAEFSQLPVYMAVSFVSTPVAERLLAQNGVVEHPVDYVADPTWYDTLAEELRKGWLELGKKSRAAFVAPHLMIFHAFLKGAHAYGPIKVSRYQHGPEEDMTMDARVRVAFFGGQEILVAYHNASIVGVVEQIFMDHDIQRDEVS